MAACILSGATFSGIVAANDIIVVNAFYFTMGIMKTQNKASQKNDGQKKTPP